MALFQSSKKVRQLEQQVKALQYANNTNITANMNAYLQRQFSSVSYYPDWNLGELTSKYATSDQVYAVVNKIAETSALIPVYPYSKTEEKSLRQLKTLTNRQFYSTKGLFDIRVMQMKALEDLPENNDLYMLLERPNNYQSKNEFLNAVYTYYLLNGEVFVYKMKLDEGANAGKATSLHILPPPCVTLHVTESYPQQVTGYDFTVNGERILQNEPPENIIHWKRFNPAYALDGSQFRGLSPLRAGAMVIKRLDEADNRSINQLKNGAVPGIVYDKSFAGDESEVSIFDSQKKAFYDFITNPGNQGAPFFVGSEKGYLPIGLSAADLKLIELQNIDFKRLCNIYKISTILFNSDVAATESNVQEQIKQMYTSACLPMVYSFVSKLNSELVSDYSGKSYYINADISEITELQDDIKEMIQAVAALPISLSGNELRALLKYDEMPQPWMNEPTIKSGYSFYNDVNIPPVDDNLLNE